MVFKRYSNPFSLLEPLIENNQLSDFINTFNERVIEDYTREIWLHKVFDNRSFEDFKKGIHKNFNAQDSSMSKNEINTTLIKSNNILSNFKPQEEG